ncbi:hypothetical protein [Bradyrhizobium zhanjiangense]|nr:hypothetical protein [Bradyrhizobium zhanjiangense]
MTPLSHPVLNAIDLDGIDFKLFGIVGTKVMSGTRIISERRAS